MADEREIEKLIEERCSKYGNTIYLLGTASFGATNDPIKIDSIAHLYSIFGTRGSLIDAYKSIYKLSTNAEVYCCKVSGTHAGATLNINLLGDNIESNALILKSKCSNKVYNDILIGIYPDMISFEFPEELGSGVISYLYKDYLTLGNLVKKINFDTEEGLNHVYARITVDESTNLYGAIDTVNPSSTYMFGADDGLTISKNSLYQSLKDSYELLEGKPIDIIIPLNACIDDIEVSSSDYGTAVYGENYYTNNKDKLSGTDNGSPKSFYNALLKFCGKQLSSGISTLGIMGYNKTPDKYLNENTDKYVDNVLIGLLKANQFDLSLEIYRPLVSVVAGDLISSYDGTSFNGAAVYGVTLASSNVISTPTNKPLPNSLFLYNEFDEDNLIKLSENGIVVFRHSPVKDRVVVSSSITSCDSESEMYYVQNVRMIQLSTCCIYDIFSKYIGEDIDSLMKNGKLEDALNSGLRILIDKGMLSNYKITVSKVNNNDISLILEIKTEYMVDFIKSICTVSGVEV